MGISYNPRIVTDGLVLCLDAANTKSYPGSGTAWTDISSKGGSATLTNGPTFSSTNLGSIVFDGTDDYVSSNSNVTLGSQFTVSVWVRHITLPSSNQNYISLSGSNDVFFRHKGADASGKLDISIQPKAGNLWVWGGIPTNRGRAIGLGTIEDIERSVPVTTVSGGNNWKSVSFLTSGGSGIKSDGTLWTWGKFPDSPLGRLPPVVDTPVTTILGGTNWADTATTAAADLYTISSAFTGIVEYSGTCAAIKTDGTLWLWGNNSFGHLGTNDVIRRHTPVTTILGGTNWAKVSCCGTHIAATKTDGTLWLWGRNSYGQLGTNDLEPRTTPVTTILGGTNWKQPSCGIDLTVATKTDGRLWVWGNNYYGQLGINKSGSTTGNAARSTPVTTFLGGTDWGSVHCGDGNSQIISVKTDGTLWTWGANFSSQLGINRDALNPIARSIPVTTVLGGTTWKQASCGINNAAAIKTDGTLWVWGDNQFGQLGNDFDGISIRSIPTTTILGGTTWKQVHCSPQYSMGAVKTDGTLWMWGPETTGFGKFGIGTYSVSNIDLIGTPIRYISRPVTTILGGTNWKQIQCGYNTIALNDDGTNKRLFTWGGCGLETGSGVLLDQTPTKVFGEGTNWSSISSGYQSRASIKTDGTLWVWGGNSSGQLGTNNITETLTPVTTFLGGNNWSSVSMGIRVTAAVKTNGTLWTWGRNYNGILGINKDNQVLGNQERSTPVTTFLGGTNWSSVDVGISNIAAIKTDGTLWIWGVNNNGQLGINNASLVARSTPITTILGGTNWRSVSCGNNNIAAIKTDGTLWTWGYNNVGQLGINDVTDRFTPVTTILGNTDWSSVITNKGVVGAIKTDGTLWVWGNNQSSGLGNDTPGGSLTPVTTILGGTTWKAISNYELSGGILGTGSEVSASETSSLGINTFYNVVAVCDGTYLYLYKNNVLVSLNVAVSLGDFGSSSFFISSLTEPFNGNIYNVMVHDRALSSTEITQNFNALRGRFGI